MIDARDDDFTVEFDPDFTRNIGYVLDDNGHGPDMLNGIPATVFNNDASRVATITPAVPVPGRRTRWPSR